jgi:GTP-sensing pleiotropic transcriptional regulator CodY
MHSEITGISLAQQRHVSRIIDKLSFQSGEMCTRAVADRVLLVKAA